MVGNLKIYPFENLLFFVWGSSLKHISHIRNFAGVVFFGPGITHKRRLLVALIPAGKGGAIDCRNQPGTCSVQSSD